MIKEREEEEDLRKFNGVHRQGKIGKIFLIASKNQRLRDSLGVREG